MKYIESSQNMQTVEYPIVVIGSGAGGLVAAIGSAAAGKKVLLIEGHLFGGDCTNYGCIPSKAIIASAHHAHVIRSASTFGVQVNHNEIDTSQVFKRIKNIVEGIRSHEEPEALKKRGVDTLIGYASFVSPHELIVNDQGDETRVLFKKCVIATGSQPFIPAISGLESTPFHTNETIFSLKQVPSSLTIIGGGPIGCELAQAFSRLGSQVSVIQNGPQLIPREEPSASEKIQHVFQKEGIKLYLSHSAHNVENKGKFIQIQIMNERRINSTLQTEALLIATGRKANIKKLKLNNTNIAHSTQGIQTDKYGRTTQKHIYAVGDCCGKEQFTHVAENQARAVLTSLLLPGPLQKSIDRKQAIPRVTYTDPEVASIGINEQTANKTYGKKRIATYTIPMSQVDRAIATGNTTGFVKVVTKKWSSKILGATIVAPRAGEMLTEIGLAMQHKIPLRKLSSLIHAYPSYSQSIRLAADQWLKQTIVPTIKRWLSK